MLRVLPSLLLFVSPVLAEKVAPPEVPPAAAPAIVKEALVGSWHLDMEVAGVRVKGVTEYQDGGTFQSRATFVVEDETIELSLKGTWKLEGSILTTTITESSDPEFATVGEVSKDEILELTATALRYRDEDGLVLRETRADPAAKPPAKVPGKPVPPEDVKAIHAAIDAMERSFREADLDGIVGGTYPGLIVEAGGEAKFRESLESAAAMLKSGKVKISDVRLEDPAEFHEAGDKRVSFVPKRSTIEVDGRRVRSQGFYVAVRKKSELKAPRAGEPSTRIYGLHRFHGLSESWANRENFTEHSVFSNSCPDSKILKSVQSVNRWSICMKPSHRARTSM